MQKLNIYEAKTNLSSLVEKASHGDSFIIARAGKPMAQLVPLEAKMPTAFEFGTLKGQILVSADFDEPLSTDVLELFCS